MLPGNLERKLAELGQLAKQIRCMLEDLQRDVCEMRDGVDEKVTSCDQVRVMRDDGKVPPNRADETTTDLR